MYKKETTDKSFSKIKSLFENRSYFVRSNFLNDYDFNDEYHDYYIKFITTNALFIKNHFYLSNLVCFTIDYNMFDLSVIKVWFRLLTYTRNTVILLSILDYFNQCAYDKLPRDYIKTLSLIVEKTHKRSVKNQAYFNMLSFDESKEIYLVNLINSLKNTKDVKSLLRTISCLKMLNSKRLRLKIKNQIREFSFDLIDSKDKNLILSTLKQKNHYSNQLRY